MKTSLFIGRLTLGIAVSSVLVAIGVMQVMTGTGSQ